MKTTWECINEPEEFFHLFRKNNDEPILLISHKECIKRVVEDERELLNYLEGMGEFVEDIWGIKVKSKMWVKTEEGSVKEI